MTDQSKEFQHQLRVEEILTAVDDIKYSRVRDQLSTVAEGASHEQLEAAITMTAKRWGNMERTEFVKTFLTPSLTVPPTEDEKRKMGIDDPRLIRRYALEQVAIALAELERIRERTGIESDQALQLFHNNPDRYAVLTDKRFPKIRHLGVDKDFIANAPVDGLSNLIKARDFIEQHSITVTDVTSIRELVEMPPLVTEELFRLRPVPGKYERPRSLADNLHCANVAFAPLLQATPEQVQSIAEDIHAFFAPPEGMRVPHDPTRTGVDEDREIREQFTAVFRNHGVTAAVEVPDPVMRDVTVFINEMRGRRGRG